MNRETGVVLPPANFASNAVNFKHRQLPGVVFYSEGRRVSSRDTGKLLKIIYERIYFLSSWSLMKHGDQNLPTHRLHPIKPP